MHVQTAAPGQVCRRNLKQYAVRIHEGFLNFLYYFVSKFINALGLIIIYYSNVDGVMLCIDEVLLNFHELQICTGLR